MASKVFIRVDGSEKIGLGHVTRCIALAQAIRDRFQVKFFCKQITQPLEDELTDLGFTLERINFETDFLKRLNSETIVVLDGYHFDSDMQKSIKSLGSKLVCIDDLYKGKFYSDLIINHSACATIGRYNAMSWTKFGLGPKYSLIRPSFVLQAKKCRSINKIKTVLICVGGSDQNQFSEKILKEVLNFNEFKKIYLVVGSAFKGEVDKFQDSHKRVVIKKSLNEKEMLDLMLKSDLAVIPASGIILEAMAAGCKILTFWYSDNQRDFHDYIVNNNFVASFGDNSKEFRKKTFLKVLNQLLNDQEVDGYQSLRREISNSKDNLLKIFMDNFD